MTRRILDKDRDGTDLVLATHNQGKVREFGPLVQPFGFTLIAAGTLGLPEPVEDGTTFIRNAQIKAHAAAQASGKPAFSDDSGLAVDALHGAPGIFSARWAGPGKDFSVAMQRVWDEIGDRAGGWERPDDYYAAHFVCALCIAWPDGHDECVEGYSYGRVVWPPRGGNGFGYDPMFVPTGYDETFGELGPNTKNALSHRYDAFHKLANECLMRQNRDVDAG